MIKPLDVPLNGSKVDDRVSSNADAFLIPAMDKTIFYDPLGSRIAVLNDDEVSALKIAFAELSSEKSPKPALTTTKKKWKPTQATFSNTQKCTLRCKYCYADGGRLDDAVIDLSIAKSAIDLIISNCEGSEKPGINFLGEGEATSDWKTFVSIIDYFKESCSRSNLVGHVDLSTNGVFNHKYIDYIAANVDRTTFSVDGLSSSHDKGRVLPSGAGSFDLVLATMKEFDRRSLNYDIRSTATVEATHQLPAFVEFIGSNLQVREIHVEPVFDVSSFALTIDPVKSPPAEAFVSAFRKARQIGAKYGVSLYFSSSDLELKDSFCGASDARNLIITSKGIVTSCNEVLRADDRRAGLFQYGAWSKDKQELTIDQDKVSALANLKVHNMRKCEGCFAKYNCAGDCYAKTLAEQGEIQNSTYTSRCIVTRELLRDNLMIEVGKYARSAEIGSS
ncbi:radical SAM protein [Paracoccus tegillarcae]|uniref:Radical SAM protein n=1 Tax=Paracoccus tegillarcae TaxID=1529068 RepID=A0A2K9EL69_9RHOB|nr:SPASM domain-containing protein [Paracoccus tegillarcae]AUH32345.1 hypothetical protein CUV01_02125 [Paracoccus tegillarcae]